MATYRITAPDGGEYEITAPDDATEEQVLAYAQQNYRGAQAPAPRETPQQKYERIKAELDARNGTQGQDPTAGMSGAERLAAGFGRSIVETGRGLQQLVGARSDEQVAQDRLLDAPLLDTTGGFVGNLAGGAVQMMAPVPGAAAARLGSIAGRAAPYVGAAARGAAFSGSQSVGEGESRGGNAAIGGALGAAGQGIASGAGALASRARTALTPTVQTAIQNARAAGIPLHLSQVTDSRFLKTLGSVANSLPFSGANKAGQRQQEAFNRAVSRGFGEDAAQVSDDVLQSARQRIGAVYDDVYSRNTVSLDDAALKRLSDIEQSAARNLPPNEAAVVKNQIDDIINATQNGAMPGRMYQAFRTDRLLPMEGGTRSFQTGLIRDIRRALDEAAERSVGPDDAKALAQARRQWRNLRTTEKSLAQVSGAGGNVRPASLWPIVNQSKGATPEMRELARIGQTVLKDPIPNSGTPERDLIYRLLGLGGGGALAGVSLPALAGTAAAGIGIGRAMNSPLAALALGQGRPMSGLARLVQPAPRLLPAATPAVAPAVNGLELDIAGGRQATPEEIARDEEIVRRARRR